jgi:hypothetical protein
MPFPPLIEQLYDTSKSSWKIKESLLPKIYYYPLFYNSATMTEPLATVLPANVNMVSVDSSDTDGEDFTVTITSAHDNLLTEILSNTEPTDISDFAGKCVTFMVTVLNGDFVGFTLKFYRE